MPPLFLLLTGLAVLVLAAVIPASVSARIRHTGKKVFRILFISSPSVGVMAQADYKAVDTTLQTTCVCCA